MKDIFDNDIIKAIVKVIKDIDFSPDFSDPQTKLSLILFSTEAVILLISVILWFFANLFNTFDRWGVKEQKEKSNSKVQKAYSYHDSSYHDKSFFIEEKHGFLSLFITKFILPVTIIFGVIYLGVNIFGVIK